MLQIVLFMMRNGVERAEAGDRDAPSALEPTALSAERSAAA